MTKSNQTMPFLDMELNLGPPLNVSHMSHHMNIVKKCESHIGFLIENNSEDIVDHHSISISISIPRDNALFLILILTTVVKHVFQNLIWTFSVPLQ